MYFIFLNQLGCQIIRDWKTGDSLQYAFIEFETVEACEQAYFKMNGVIIDERRIKVDFSQSVSKLWFNFKKGQMNQNKKDDKANELMLPNENQKLEIRSNKNFMNENKNYQLLLENDKATDYDYDRYEDEKRRYKDKKESKKHRKHQKKGRSRSFSKSDSDSSESRSRSRSRKKEPKDNYYNKKYSKDREREKDDHYRSEKHKARK